MNIYEQLKEQDCKPFFYYEDTTTVCLLHKDGQVISRGLAICSFRDNFVKRVGRAKALGRALQAVHHNSNIGSINPQRFDHEYVKNEDTWLPYADRLWKATLFGSWKAYFEPELTTKELTIVNGKNNNMLKE